MWLMGLEIRGGSQFSRRRRIPRPAPVSRTPSEAPPEYPDRSLTIRQVIEEVVLPAGKPVISGYMIGHCSPKITVPLGVEATLDADKGLVILEEAALSGR